MVRAHATIRELPDAVPEIDDLRYLLSSIGPARMSAMRVNGRSQAGSAPRSMGSRRMCWMQNGFYRQRNFV